MKAMVSVVIPAFNEEELINRCLDAFIKRNTSQKFEVILVDNNSTDRTVKFAKNYLTKLNLRILIQKQKGRGAARYMGFENAKGTFILSTDADCLVPSNWIEEHTKTIHESNSVAVTGTCKINDLGTFSNVILNFTLPMFMKTYKLFTGHYWLSGFNFAIYKDVYDKSGGFNPDLNVQEDTELAFRVAKIGKIKLVSGLPVLFSGRRFKKGIIKGLIPYLVTFSSYFLFKNENSILPDIR